MTCYASLAARRLSEGFAEDGVPTACLLVAVSEDDAALYPAQDAQLLAGEGGRVVGGRGWHGGRIGLAALDALGFCCRHFEMTPLENSSGEGGRRFLNACPAYAREVGEG